MPSGRKGFTLVEMLIVVILIGAMTVVAIPRVGAIMEKNSVRSAKQEIASTLAVARAAAIHNGRASAFVRSGNSARAWVSRNAGWQAVSAPVDVSGDHHATLSTSADTIRFDPRGFATGIVGAYQTITITRASFSDSVCVTRFGRIIAEGRCL